MSVVSLNQRRTAKARVDRKAKADENSVRFGRTKAERELETAQERTAQAKLDGHRREPE
ncbi:DUF4169 family protein [Aestuariibius insulae]|uniref:DUF4169 family protein n=1 Tax=Aestuariibius insulae TaxID=2058287 RepID=UPI00345EA098